MQKELLITTLLLSAPVAKSFHTNASEIIREAQLATDHLLGMSFKSKIKSFPTYRDDNVFDGFVEVTFQEDDNFTWYTNGSNELPPTIGMSIRLINAETNQEEYTLGDSFYFAKKTGKNTYRVYDCDSTSNCDSEYGFTDFYIFNTPNGKLIKIKKNTSKVNNFLVTSLLEK